MHIHLRTDSQHGDIVVLDDGTELRWSQWLAATERAVRAVRAVLDRPRLVVTEQEIVAALCGKRWLVRCGILTLDQFVDLEKHLPLLRLPPDPAHARACRRCGSPIWGRRALLTGLGSACRRGRMRCGRGRAVGREQKLVEAA